MEISVFGWVTKRDGEEISLEKYWMGIEKWKFGMEIFIEKYLQTTLKKLQNQIIQNFPIFHRYF